MHSRMDMYLVFLYPCASSEDKSAILQVHGAGRSGFYGLDDGERRWVDRDSLTIFSGHNESRENKRRYISTRKRCSSPSHPRVGWQDVLALCGPNTRCRMPLLLLYVSLCGSPKISAAARCPTRRGVFRFGAGRTV